MKSTSHDSEKQEKYYVVCSDDHQYSLWPTIKTIPFGWIALTPALLREECLNYIANEWQDMRFIENVQ